ncbi:MAG: DUF5076 domain-containing protein [Xanthobacteraceae bacterium]|nr:DUF5076 domain-containing protein [Xanthobacteraceae bacterium]PWB59779.1 MAG: DUF5076 domain-containing protein [Bradyrhizobiaceae bacterium]
MAVRYNALNIPPSVKTEAHEVLRAAVQNRELHVSLRRAFDDPAAWGLLFVDVTRHVTRLYAHDKVCSEQEALDRIRAAFEAAIREPEEGVSSTTEIKDGP